jgi:hypothetical protein
VGGETRTADVLEPFAVKSAAPHEVTGSARIGFGAMEVGIRLRMEVDGWTVYELALACQPDASADSLIMDFPLAGSAVSLHHVVGEHHTGNIAAELPEGDGVVWDSCTPANALIRGHFKPYVWLGNESMGLAWMADSDRGWHADDEKPCIDIVRDPSGRTVRLRLHLINLPTPLNKERTITFGILATPSKPLPPDFRRWSQGGVASPRKPTTVVHATFRRGWAHGFGSAFYPQNHDYTNVRKIVEGYKNRGITHLLFYNGFGFIGMNYPEVAYFDAEWLGKDPVTYSIKDRFGETKPWGNDPKAYRTGGAALVDSFMDFALWYMRLNLAEAGFDGVYFDLFNPGFSDRPEMGAYERDDGTWQVSSDLFRKREFLRRIAVVMHEEGMPPMSMVHMTGTLIAPCLSFAQICFDGEMRGPPEGYDHIDTWPADLLRAESMGKPYGLVPFFLQGGGRPLVGLLAVHDMLECRNTEASFEYQRVLADFGVGVGNTDVAFHGYWDDYGIATGDPDVLCSTYTRPGKAFMVFLNRSREPRQVTAEVVWADLEVKPAVLRDPQRNAPVALEGNRFTLDVDGHDYRVLVVEPNP